MVAVAYLVPGTGLSADEQARRERVANDLVRADVSVVSADADGPSSIESSVEEAWCVVGSMRTAHEIESDFDAVVVGCFGDPGLRALRELLEIPVVGPAESTLHTAVQVADRFGWLTILEETVPMCREQVREHGFSEQCAGVRSVDAPVESIDHDSTELAERMVDVGRRAVEADGAEVLFPGCMSLSFARQGGYVEDRVEVPFLDPATLALEQAETWARHGLSQSERSYPAPKFEKLDALL